MRVCFLEKLILHVNLVIARTLRLAFLQISGIDNQMTIYYQDVHLKASHVLPISGLPILIFTFSLELTKKWHLLALLFMRLLSNQIRKDFVASSNEIIKLSISMAKAYGVSSSA